MPGAWRGAHRAPRGRETRGGRPGSGRSSARRNCNRSRPSSSSSRHRRYGRQSSLPLSLTRQSAAIPLAALPSATVVHGICSCRASCLYAGRLQARSSVRGTCMHSKIYSVRAGRGAQLVRGGGGGGRGRPGGPAGAEHRWRPGRHAGRQPHAQMHDGARSTLARRAAVTQVPCPASTVQSCV